MYTTNSLVSAVTRWRNPNGDEYQWTRTALIDREIVTPTKVICAEALYLAIIPYAVVETAFCIIGTFFGLLIRYPVFFPRAVNGIFGLGWTITNVVRNLFCNDLLVYPQNAARCTEGNLFEAPILCTPMELAKNIIQF